MKGKTKVSRTVIFSGQGQRQNSAAEQGFKPRENGNHLPNPVSARMGNSY
jgi:hypothetical protein